MNNHPIVASVIIPVYNGMKTLPLQLEALEQQKGSLDFEVLISDNGSSDGLVECLSRWEGQRFELRYINSSQYRGAAYARNHAAAQARGDYLLFCDADDLVDELWVADAVEALTLYPVVTGAARTVFEKEFLAIKHPVDGWMKWRERATEDIYTVPGEGSLAPVLLGGNFAIRRSLFDRLGGFDAYFASGSEDNDLSFRIKEIGILLTESRNMKILYRIREDWRKLIFRGYQTGYTFSELAAKHNAWDWALPYKSLTLLSIPKSFVKFLINFKSNDLEGNISRFSTFMTVCGLLVGKFKYQVMKKEIDFQEGLGYYDEL